MKLRVTPYVNTRLSADLSWITLESVFCRREEGGSAVVTCLEISDPAAIAQIAQEVRQLPYVTQVEILDETVHFTRADAGYVLHSLDKLMCPLSKLESKFGKRVYAVLEGKLPISLSEAHEWKKFVGANSIGELFGAAFR